MILSLAQILAGNARKVSAVRFERITNDEAKLEANEVTRFVPKIMKRKWSNGEDSDSTEYDGDTYYKRPEDDPSDADVTAEYEHDHNRTNKH